MTFRLLPKAKTDSLPKHKQVAARTLAVPKKIRTTDFSAFSGLNDNVGYTEFWCTRASPTVLGKIRGYELPMMMDGGVEICMLSEEVTRELNSRWKRADCKMIGANCNQFDLTKVAEFIPINIQGIVIPVTTILAKSDLNRLSWVTPGKDMLESVRDTWMLAVVR